MTNKHQACIKMKIISDISELVNSYKEFLFTK